MRPVESSAPGTAQVPCPAMSVGSASSMRDVVLAAVRARTPVDARERASIRRFLTDFSRLAEPFSEHAGPVHVTGSGLVVGPRGILLHRHRILGTWVQPGGHVDPGETPWEAAVRETVEETGVTVAHPPAGHELAHVDVHPGPRGHLHLDLRYLLNGDGEPKPPPGESQEVGWFSWEEALAISEPSMRGILHVLAAAAH
jgi:8-oxo-dGTP pyrophosphatase MutT (NUDIX family)